MVAERVVGEWGFVFIESRWLFASMRRGDGVEERTAGEGDMQEEEHETESTPVRIS